MKVWCCQVMITLSGRGAVKFLSVRCTGEDYQLLGEGNVKPFQQDVSGQTDVNFWNGFPKVQMQPASETVFFRTEDVARKVMLYDCWDNITTVVEYYMRKLRSLPYVACEQALLCGVGGWREEERDLAIMSHKFEFVSKKWTQNADWLT